MNRLQKPGLIYLYLLPAIVAGIGFGIGHVSYLIYVPVCLVNTCLVFLIINLFLKCSPENKGIQFRGWAIAGVL